MEEDVDISPTQLLFQVSKVHSKLLLMSKSDLGKRGTLVALAAVTLWRVVTERSMSLDQSSGVFSSRVRVLNPGHDTCAVVEQGTSS